MKGECFMFGRPPIVMPPVVHPTKCCVQFNCQEVIVPHVHPTHTTFVNQTNFKHNHYFPQTQSALDPTTSQHFSCGQPPCCPQGPMGGPQGPWGPRPPHGYGGY